MDKRICIITGANAGIGREAAVQIAGKGYHIILACRNETRGNEALESLLGKDSNHSAELMIVDMGLKSSVKTFADEVKSRFTTIDILIHNAAVFDLTQKEAVKTSEGIESVWAVNHLGPVLLTELLLANLKNSSEGRIITVASKGLVAMPSLKIDLVDPEFSNRKFSVTKAYYQSKRAQIIYTYWLARRLKASGITVNCIRVTAVQIDISRHPGLSTFTKWIYSIKSRMALTPAQMAETYTWLATSSDVKGVTGRYYDEKQREVKSAKYTFKRKNQHEVLDLTMKYLENDV